MPTLTFSKEIDVKSFIKSCDDNEIHELIDYLFEIGFLKKILDNKNLPDDLKKMTSEEIKYEDALNRLKNKYNKLSYLDVTIIIELSKKFQ